jgi:predicted DNA-binding transcriptional regulator AlpA
MSVVNLQDVNELLGRIQRGELTVEEANREADRLQGIESEPTWWQEPAVAARYGVSRSCIRNWVRLGRFPRPAQLTPGCKRWHRSQIHEYDATIMRQLNEDGYAPDPTWTNSIDASDVEAEPPRPEGPWPYGGPRFPN